MNREKQHEGLRICVRWEDGAEKASIDLLAIVERMLARQKLLLREARRLRLETSDFGIEVSEAIDSAEADLDSINSLYESMSDGPSVALRAPVEPERK